MLEYVICNDVQEQGFFLSHVSSVSRQVGCAADRCGMQHEQTRRVHRTRLRYSHKLAGGKQRSMSADSAKRARPLRRREATRSSGVKRDAQQVSASEQKQTPKLCFSITCLKHCISSTDQNALCRTVHLQPCNASVFKAISLVRVRNHSCHSGSTNSCPINAVLMGYSHVPSRTYDFSSSVRTSSSSELSQISKHKC